MKGYELTAFLKINTNISPLPRYVIRSQSGRVRLRTPETMPMARRTAPYLPLSSSVRMRSSCSAVKEWVVSTPQLVNTSSASWPWW